MTKRTCPLCGAPRDWQERLTGNDRPSWGAWEKHEYTNYAFGAEAIPAGSEYVRKRPVRDASLEGDVTVPGLQSLFTGVTGGVAIGALAAIFHVPRPFPIGLAGGAGVLAVCWLVLLKEHRSLLWEVEKILNTDLDHDGRVGRSEPVAVDAELEPATTRVEVTERKRGGNVSMRFVDVPASDSELTGIARAVLVRKENFSRRGLAGILSQGKYAETYEKMLDGGLLRPDGRGAELSPSGRAFLGQYLK